MWHFVPKALPVLVHAPGDGGYPAEAALNKDKLELGKALRHPFDDQAGELTGNRVGVRMVLFVVVGRPAASRWRVTAIGRHGCRAASLQPRRRHRAANSDA